MSVSYTHLDVYKRQAQTRREKAMTTIDLVRTPNVDKELLGILLAYKRELSDEQIAEMLKKMRPVVRRDGELFYICLLYTSRCV